MKFCDLHLLIAAHTPCSSGFMLKMFEAAGENLQFSPLNKGFTIPLKSFSRSYFTYPEEHGAYPSGFYVLFDNWI